MSYLVVLHFCREGNDKSYKIREYKSYISKLADHAAILYIAQVTHAHAFNSNTGHVHRLSSIPVY